MHATYEFHFITKGTGAIITDDTQYEAAPDSYYIIRPGVYHMQKDSPADPIHKYSFKFEFDIGNNNDGYSEVEVKNLLYVLSNIQFFYSKNLDKIKGIITEIQKELISSDMGYYTKVQHLFSILFTEIIREIAAEHKQFFKTPQRVHKQDRINIIDNFFDLNYYHKPTIEDLCSLVHLSKSQLNRILKEKYNMTFKQKHIEAQIEHIKDMLTNTELPIGVIAEKTGYTCESNFTAFFKHSTGMSPKAYRKRNNSSFGNFG
jgi:AraC-type DNA-binding domain-containing proteins